MLLTLPSAARSECQPAPVPGRGLAARAGAGRGPPASWAAAMETWTTRG
jgi:hypothetical protein